MNVYLQKVFQEFEKENKLITEKNQKQHTDSVIESLTLHELVKIQTGKYSYDATIKN